jgi:hypothetical protein
MKLIELKELLFAFPEDSEVVIELPDENELIGDDLYNFTVSHVMLDDGYEIRLCLTPNH